MKVRPGAMVRGAGVAVACLSSSQAARSRILFAAYAVGWRLDKPGLQIFVVIPDTDEPWKRGTVPFATSVASWSTAMLITATALRRTVLPAPVSAVLLGGAVMVLDSLLADLGEAREEATDEESPVPASPSMADDAAPQAMPPEPMPPEPMHDDLPRLVQRWRQSGAAPRSTTAVLDRLKHIGVKTVERGRALPGRGGDRPGPLGPPVA